MTKEDIVVCQLTLPSPFVPLYYFQEWSSCVCPVQNAPSQRMSSCCLPLPCRHVESSSHCLGSVAETHTAVTYIQINPLRLHFSIDIHQRLVEFVYASFHSQWHCQMLYLIAELHLSFWSCDVASAFEAVVWRIWVPKDGNKKLIFSLLYWNSTYSYLIAASSWLTRDHTFALFRTACVRMHCVFIEIAALCWRCRMMAMAMSNHVVCHQEVRVLRSVWWRL